MSSSIEILAKLFRAHKSEKLIAREEKIIPINNLFDISNKEWIEFLAQTGIIQMIDINMQFHLNLNVPDTFKIQYDLSFKYDKFYKSIFLAFNDKFESPKQQIRDKEIVIDIYEMKSLPSARIYRLKYSNLFYQSD